MPLHFYNGWQQHRGNLKIGQTNIGALLKDLPLNNWKISNGFINSINLHWGGTYETLKYIKGSINANDVTIIQPPSKTASPAPHPSKQKHSKSSTHQKLQNKPTTWQLKSVLTHFVWQGKLNDTWTFKLQRAQMNLDGQDWIEKNFQITSAPIKRGGALYTIHASNLHLPNLWPLLKKLTLLPKEQEEMIKHLNPQGDLKNIYFEYPHGMTVNSNVKPAKIGEQVSATLSFGQQLEPLPTGNLLLKFMNLLFSPGKKFQEFNN